MKKTILVHDWLIHMRGGEKVLEALAEMYPDAVIYTLFFNKRKLSPSLQKMKIKASWLQRLPFIDRYYRFLLPFLPAIARRMEIREDADLVISTSHCVAKGIRIPKNAFHLCYCHTPMRYIWGFEEMYFGKFPRIFKPLINRLIVFLRQCDLESNKNVHQFVSNSENVRKRIKSYYQRDSVVIYPPLDSKLYQPKQDKKDYYLVVSAFVPYKKVDIVIEAFNAFREKQKKLLIVGAGPMEQHYRSLRKNTNIHFLGSVSDARLKELYAEAKALIFPTEEDFGIVPLEAQSCGTPVIALARGGALESVQLGVFFPDQTAESVRQGIAEFESTAFDPDRIRESVRGFDKQAFKDKIHKLVASLQPKVMS